MTVVAGTSLETLRTSLQAQIDQSGSITIDDATLQTIGISTLISGSPLRADKIVVSTTEQIPPPTTTLTVSGTVSFLDVTASASVVFSSSLGGISFTLTESLPDRWNFGQSFPTTRDSPLDKLTFTPPRFVFTTTPVPPDTQTVGLAPGLNFSGMLSNFKEEFADGLALLGVSSPPLTVVIQGPLAMQGGAPVIDIRAMLGASVQLGPIFLGGGYVGARLSASSGATAATGAVPGEAAIGVVALTVGGTVTVAGTSLDLSGSLAPGTGVVTLALATNLGLASLDALAALLGAEEGWRQLLPSQLSALGGFALRAATAVADVEARGTPAFVRSITVTMGIDNPWPIVGGAVTVTGLHAVWLLASPSDPSQHHWSLSSTAQAALGPHGDVVFDLDVAIPGLTVTGSLIAGHTYDLASLTTSLFGAAISLPPDLVSLTLDSVTFTAVPSSTTYSVRAEGSISVNLFGEADLALHQIVATLSHSTATGASGSVSAQLTLAGLTFEISATLAATTLFHGSLSTPTSIHATTFLSQLTRHPVSVPAEVPDFELSVLTVDIDSAKHSVSLAADIDARWSIPLANASPSIRVSFHVASAVASGVRSYAGSVCGEVAVGQVFTVVYTFGDAVSVVKGSWSGGGGMSYANVAGALGIGTSAIRDPLGYSMPDFGITSAELVIDLKQPSVGFTATSSDYGTAYFSASKSDGTWGFFFGVAAARGWNFGHLPEPLGRDLKRLDFAEFESAYLVIASRSTTLTTAQWPALGTDSVSVVPGLNVGVLANLRTAGQASVLNDVTGIDSLFIQGAIGPTLGSVFLSATLTGAPIKIPDAGGLQISQPFVRLWLEPPALTLGGSVLIPWSSNAGAQNVTVTGLFTINVDSATFGVDVKFPALGAPLGFVGVSIKEVGASIELTYAPTFMLGLGLQAVFVLGATQSDDEFAFVFDVTVDAVNPKLLRVKIAEFDLETLFAVLAPRVTLPTELGQGIRFSNFFIYWCDEPTTLPDGSQALPGFGFNGSVNAFDVLDATAAVKIDSTKGMSGRFSLAPLTVTVEARTVLSVTGAGGGPLIFAFNTTTSPFLAWSGAVELLGVADASTQGFVTDTGFAFSVGFSLIHDVSAQVQCTYKHKTDFSASASFHIPRLDISLGPYVDHGVTVVPRVHIVGPSASLSMALTVNPQVLGDLQCQLQFRWGVSVDVSFHLTVKDIGYALANLWPQVLHWLQNNLDQVFKEVLADVEAFVDAVEQGFFVFEHGIEDVANALYHFFDQTTPQALGKWLLRAGADFEEAVRLVATYCGIAVADAAKILGNLFRFCAVTTAFTQLGNGQLTALDQATTVIPNCRHVLFDLHRSRRGRELLAGYLLNEEEVDHLLRHDLAVRAEIRHLPASQADGPVTLTLAVLDVLACHGSPHLRQAIASARPILAPSAGHTYDEFLAELERQ